MSAPIISVTESVLMTSLRAVLLLLVPSATVVQGYQNRVAMPNGTVIEMTTISTNELSMIDDPLSLWVPGSANPGLAGNTRSEEWVCQLDFFGAGASDNCRLVNLLLRSRYVYEAFGGLTPAIVAPLYTTTAKQLAFINDSQQYEPRWLFEFHGQYDPTAQVPEDFATALTVTPVNVDVQFPPEN